MDKKAIAIEEALDVSELRYFLIKEFMNLNGLTLEDVNDPYTFTNKKNLIISIVNYMGCPSFAIIFPDKKNQDVTVTSYTGDLKLPSLLGHLLWLDVMDRELFRVPKQ